MVPLHSIYKNFSIGFKPSYEGFCLMAVLVVSTMLLEDMFYWSRFALSALTLNQHLTSLIQWFNLLSFELVTWLNVTLYVFMMDGVFRLIMCVCLWVCAREVCCSWDRTETALLRYHHKPLTQAPELHMQLLAWNPICTFVFPHPCS